MHTLPQSDPKVAIGKQRITLILFFAAFISPVVIAYLLLASGWWHKVGSVNHGLLMTPPITLDTRLHQQLTEGITGVKPWLVLNILDERCSESCQNALLLARQTTVLLGPDSGRVHMVVAHTAPLDQAQQTHLKQSFSSLSIKQVDAPLLQSLLNRLPQSNTSTLTHLIIIDPLGNAMLLHPVASNPNRAIQEGKGFVKDLKRLLKLSHIG